MAIETTGGTSAQLPQPDRGSDTNLSQQDYAPTLPDQNANAFERLGLYLFGAYFFITSFFFISTAAVITLFTFAFDPNRRILHYFASFWAMFYIYTMPGWKVRYEGLDYIDPNKTYVLVANHTSFWDIWVIYGIYKPFKWVSKESIFKVPFVGQNMTLNQYVEIKRGDMKSIKEMMMTCKNWLNRKASVMIFPEGTRSENGEMQNFRDGAFRLSVDCDVPVVPIVVQGTYEIFSKTSKKLKFNQDIVVRILPPVYPKDFDRSSGKMRKHVQDLMKANYDELRGIKRLGDSDGASPSVSSR
ncbi:MAG: lysophospholipid acyltransferase family protein [Candidatus Melainabacteria bacterium]|nr:lysophospholipid acyltransferase family protein [Candidatus Melainabacteria bacterium]